MTRPGPNFSDSRIENVKITSFTHPGWNATMTYGGVVARIRVNKIRKQLPLRASESQARNTKGFYPYQRSQGDFAIGVECNGWEEVQQINAWFDQYRNVILDLDRALPLPIELIVPSRDFHRYGVPYDGVAYGDHVGSMVFNPEYIFISVSDPSDPFTTIVNSSDASQAVIPTSVDPATNFFYPTSSGITQEGVSQTIYGNGGIGKNLAALLASLGKVGHSDADQATRGQEPTQANRDRKVS